MEPKTYGTIIARRWRIILFVTLAICTASICVSKLIPPRYQAQTHLRVTTPIIGNLGDISYDTSYAELQINTYMHIATSEQVMDEVKKKLSLDTLPDINVKTVPNSEIILISVVSSDASLAAKTANTLADVIISKGQENARESSVNYDELNILTERQATLQKELDQAEQDRERLVESYAQITAQMGMLDSAIRMKEASYQNLQNQYQQAVIAEAVASSSPTKDSAKTTKDLLSTEIGDLENELSTLKKQYQDLSTSSAKYSQQLITSGQTIQNNETAYLNLMSQIVAARIANSKHESAQDIVVASPAIVPIKPSSPSPLLIIALGFLCGLIGGIMLAFLLDNLDIRVLTVEQIERLTATPILGRLPSLSRKDRNALLESTDTAVQGAYWALCTKILTIQQTWPVKTILVTSPNPAEGKSTIVMGIAAGLAKVKRKVLVVDTDLRRPSLHKLFHVSSEPGLSNFLRGENTLEEVIKNIEKPEIHFLPGGPALDDPADLFQAPLFAVLLEKIATYDVVLFDSPALLVVPDAYNLAMNVDGVILVVQRERTTIEDIQVTLGQLEDLNSKLLGTIVNRVPVKRISGYYQRKSWHIPLLSIRLPGFAKRNTMQTPSAVISEIGKARRKLIHDDSNAT